MKGIIKDAAILFAITLISGLLLGFVHDITEEPIAQQKEKAKAEACAAVFAEAAAFEEQTVAGEMNFGKGEVSEILLAQDAGGNQLGYVMTVTSNEGYGGKITFLIGIKNDGTVNGISITEINETAGLGMKAKEEAFSGQFSGKKVDSFVYTKSGASADNEIDAISSATVTTNAITNSVNGALEIFRTLSANENGGVR